MVLRCSSVSWWKKWGGHGQISFWRVKFCALAVRQNQGSKDHLAGAEARGERFEHHQCFGWDFSRTLQNMMPLGQRTTWQYTRQILKDQQKTNLMCSFNTACLTVVDRPMTNWDQLPEVLVKSSTSFWLPKWPSRCVQVVSNQWCFADVVIYTRVLAITSKTM